MPFIFAKTILDVRREPVRPTQALIEDPLQETQLLPGEEIAVIEEKGEWAYIEALEQPCFRNGWAGYKGWVERDGLGRRAAKPSWVVARHGANVSFGSKVSEKLDGCRDLGESVHNPREFLIGAALSFKGMPYQWGGPLKLYAWGASDFERGLFGAGELVLFGYGMHCAERCPRSMA
jgi:hypothetical protein